MNRDEPINILIVEDHYLVRLALRTVINTQSNLNILAEAEDSQQALDLFRQVRPDVTLMDLRIPGSGGGLETIKAIRREFPDAKIIVLTNYEGHEDIYRSLQAGVMSYLQKDVMGEELIRAIKTVNSGRNYIPLSVASRLSERMTNPGLSARETEVLTLMAQGMSNKEIAATLCISEGTVKLHVSNIITKLNVNDRTHAVSIAIQHGIIHPEQNRP